MPIIWRYLLRQFFKVFLLTTFSFILLLLITRLKEIARIVAISPDIKYICLFVLNLVPFILPIAIPIACLLSTILLYQKISASHELTALRSSGLSLSTLIYPILAVAALLSVGNFLVVSELTSKSHLYSKVLVNKLITTNPFFILEHKNNLRMRNFFIDMQTLERGKSAQNLYMIAPSKDGNHLNLMYIDQLKAFQDQLIAPHISIVSQASSKENFNHVLIENQSNMRTKAQDLTQIIKSSHFDFQVYHCSMPFLLISLEETKIKLKAALLQNNIKDIKKLKKMKALHYSEISRRISIGLSVFCFALLGLSFSIQIGRTKKKLKIFTLFCLTVFGLVCFFVGKVFSSKPITASFIYFTPHIIIILASIWSLKRISRGVE